MHTSKNKKIVTLLVLVLASFIVIVTILIFHLRFNINSYERNSLKFTEKISSNKNVYKDYMPVDELDKKLMILNNQSINEKERYQALSSIFDYYNNAYFHSNSSIYRENSKIIEDFAQKNFSKIHKKGKFDMPCADEECGEKTPKEIIEIINEVKALPVEDIWKNSIISNLKNASHIPYGTQLQKSDKIYSYLIAYNQLNDLNINQASASASKLKIFIKVKYNEDL